MPTCSQRGKDVDEEAELILDEQLEQWQRVRDSIDAGLPLPEAQALPLAPQPAQDADDEWGGVQGAATQEVDEDAPVVVCTRCYALRHYGYDGVFGGVFDGVFGGAFGGVFGVLNPICFPCMTGPIDRQLRSELAESQLPDFQLGPKVGRKIGYTRHRRAVLLCVVDATDFDGSLPRQALQQVLSTATAVAASAKQTEAEKQGAVGQPAV